MVRSAAKLRASNHASAAGHVSRRSLRSLLRMTAVTLAGSSGLLGACSTLILRSRPKVGVSKGEGGPVIDGAYLYILRCADGSYYCGTARQGLERRVTEHNSGVLGGYTSTRRPAVLVYSEWFPRITDAIAAERQIKGWSRAKKEALIRGDFGALRALSKRSAKRERD